MDTITEQTFSQWARRLNKSDESALEELFDHTFDIYVKYAWRYTKDKSSAIDIVQDSFIKLWQYRTNIDPNGSLKTYIYRMVRNKALNFLRNQREEMIDPEEMGMADPSAEVSVELESDSKPLASYFSQWISDLPRQQQRAFELSRYEGLTHDEIAEVMEIAPRTVNNHIVAALKTLKQQYDHYNSRRENGYEVI